jgi:hypothetical protein
MRVIYLQHAFIDDVKVTRIALTNQTTADGSGSDEKPQHF